MTNETGGTKGPEKGGKKGKKDEVVEPLKPLKPVFDYGDEQFNNIAEDIWDAREKLNQKTLEK